MNIKSLNRSDEGLTFETSAILPFTVANLRFQLSTQLYTLPPTQHYSFFRNLPPLLNIKTIKLWGAFLKFFHIGEEERIYTLDWFIGWIRVKADLTQNLHLRTCKVSQNILTTPFSLCSNIVTSRLFEFQEEKWFVKQNCKLFIVDSREEI